MGNQVSEAFMQALEQAEQTGDAARLVEMFSDDAEVSNLALKNPLRGREGAREFWRHYLHQFDHIHSEFTQVSETDGKAVLEWEAEGALRGGKPISYRGVTILETDRDQVRRFRSYYDSAAFLQPQAQIA